MKQPDVKGWEKEAGKQPKKPASPGSHAGQLAQNHSPKARPVASTKAVQLVFCCEHCV
jgi:hypothetical protein